MSYFVEGRVVYQMMEAYWPTADQQPDSTEAEREFARIWRGTPKVVYSRTLERVGPNATLVRDVVPAEVQALKAEAAGDLSLGGAEIVAAFQQHGLIDEYWLYIHPVVIGEGGRSSPGVCTWTSGCWRATAFGNGVVRLRYAVGRD